MQGTIQGIAPKTISGCLSRNLVSQKRVGRYIQSTERKKKITDKNTLPGKTVL